MANIIKVGNTVSGYTTTPDQTGALEIRTGALAGGTTAVTVDASQNVSIAGNLTVTGNITGTLTSGLGIGQTYQNVTANRAFATTYTNTTSRPITLNLRCNNGTQCNYSALVDGVVVNIIKHLASDAVQQAVNCLIIPSGSTYSVTFSAGTPLNALWIELR